MIDINNSTVKNILILIKPYKIKLIVSLVISSITTIILIFVPNLSKILIDQGLLNNHINIVIKLSITLILIQFLNQTLILIQKLIHQNIQNSMLYEMSSDAFNHLLKLKMCYFEQNSSFSLITSVTMSINEMCELTNTKFLNIGIEIIKIIGGIIGLSLLDFRLTFFVIFGVLIRFIGLRILKTKRIDIFESMLDINMKFSMWYSDVLNGIRVVKLWNIDKSQNYQKLIKKQINIEKKYNSLYMAEDYISNIIDTLLTYGLYIIGAFFILYKDLTIGSLFAFIMYTSLIVDPLFSLIQLDYQLSKIKPAIKTYIEFLQLNEEQISHEKENLVNCPSVNKINFNAIYWEFENRSVISNVSFEVKKKEKVALIGSNGSGKSTLVDLLLRFREPTSGEIKINDMNINEFDINEYRSIFSVIDQDCFLFNTTIKENLLIKDSDIKIPSNITKSKSIYIWLFEQIACLSKGLDTQTGHNGTLLSGGEKQKVILLRSLLKYKAKILILDEATSSYDISSEKTFNDFILNTDLYDFILVVSHRPEVLKAVDRILIIENGTIIANGNFNDLYNLNLLQKYIV